MQPRTTLSCAPFNSLCFQAIRGIRRYVMKNQARTHIHTQSHTHTHTYTYTYTYTHAHARPHERIHANTDTNDKITMPRRSPDNSSFLVAWSSQAGQASPGPPISPPFTLPPNSETPGPWKSPANRFHLAQMGSPEVTRKGLCRGNDGPWLHANIGSENSAMELDFRFETRVCMACNVDHRRCFALLPKLSRDCD